MTDGRGRLTVEGMAPERPQIASDGWISADLGDDLRVHVRVGRAADRWSVAITGLYIDAPDITSSTLQRVHPTRVLAAIESVGPDLRRPDGSQIFESMGQVGPDKDAGLTLGELRSRAAGHQLHVPRERLGRPDGSPDFYRRAADAYRSAAAESAKPAVVLAEENDVPVETVRRWVKEARRRGFLTGGRKGRAL